MKPWMIAIIVRPLAVFLFFAFAYYLGKVILYFVPSGKLKELLTTPVGGFKRVK